jgi:fatty-acid desaturase
MYSAPAHLGPWTGLLIGAAYFVFCWFVAGLYLADVLHLGIAHRSLDYKEWFVKIVTVLNNAFGIYVEPVSWVNRHRLHHKNADHDGDPNKLSGDGFWRTGYLCVLPYNYWTHTRNFGYRRYDDDDNAMNIGEWLPVTATFSACLQNNHHHYPGLLRLSHDESEYDFGFLTVKIMKHLGLVKATARGEKIPEDVPLSALGF